MKTNKKHCWTNPEEGFADVGHESDRGCVALPRAGSTQPQKATSFLQQPRNFGAGTRRHAFHRGISQADAPPNLQLRRGNHRLQACKSPATRLPISGNAIANHLLPTVQISTQLHRSPANSTLY